MVVRMKQDSVNQSQPDWNTGEVIENSHFKNQKRKVCISIPDEATYPVVTLGKI